MPVEIRALTPDDHRAIEQIAQFCTHAFRTIAPDYMTTVEEAREEIAESFADDRISRVAVDGDSNTAIGWIGGILTYEPFAWELHPLAVDPGYQGHGIGRALAADLETQVKARGGLTIYLGSDDELGLTSLHGIDLYPNPLEHLARIQNLKRHPYEFYQKCGFVFTGIVPDANGFGKPDLLMAKRVG
ncbi:MAG: GNAT family N-acetyltransferase [Anaerolineae bacterium]|nr:GNAT family N-acetyltransferase [Anaerolineae bacterium]